MSQKFTVLLVATLMLIFCVAEGPSMAQEPEVIVSNVISSHLAIRNDELIWSEVSDTPLRKMPKDGGPITTLAHAMGAAKSIIVHEGNIFWLEDRGRHYDSGERERRLNKMSLDGTSISVLAYGSAYIEDEGSGIFYSDMVLHENNIYWVTDSFFGPSQINRTPIMGGETTTIATAQGKILSLHLDNGNLFWIDEKNIMGMSIDVGSPSVIFSTSDYWTDLKAGIMAVHEGEMVFVFQTNVNQYNLMRISTSGGQATSLIELGEMLPSRIIINGGNVYWTYIWQTPDNSINKIPIAGGEHVQLAATGPYPIDILVIGNSLYWTEGRPHSGLTGTGSIKKVPEIGGQVTLVAEGLDAPIRIISDGLDLYFAEQLGAVEIYTSLDGRLAKVPLNGGPVQTLVNGLANLISDESWDMDWTVPFISNDTLAYIADGASIKMVPLIDGSLERLVTFTHPIIDLTMDNYYIYSLDAWGRVRKTPIAGGQTILLADYQVPPPITHRGRIVLRDDNLYWAFFGIWDSVIHKIRINGTEQVTYTFDLSYLADFTVDSENIFLCSMQIYLYRMPINGGPPVMIGGCNDRMTWATLTSDENYIYAIDEYSEIRRTSKVGGDTTTLSSGRYWNWALNDIALQQNTIYYTQPATESIMKMNIPSSAQCSYSILRNKTVPSKGGKSTLAILGSGVDDCRPPGHLSLDEWITPSLVHWLNNKGKLILDVKPNINSSARTGTILIAGTPISILQKGKNCVFQNITPSSQLVPASGGDYSCIVTTEPLDCSWNASTEASFVQTSASQGTGNGTIAYRVAENDSGKTRSASIAIAFDQEQPKKKRLRLKQSR